jgi:ArsR family transcriptional regulator
VSARELHPPHRRSIWDGNNVKARLLSVLPSLSPDMSDAELDRMAANAIEAANLLKALGHEGRLMILCHLATGEKSVTELERALSSRQAAVSQQLARLRHEGLVRPRREGKTIFYALADERARQVMELVYQLYCARP